MKNNTHTTPAVCALALIIIFAAAMARGDEPRIKFTNTEFLDAEYIFPDQVLAFKVVEDYHISWDASLPGSPTTVTLHLAGTPDLELVEVSLTSDTLTLRIGENGYENEFFIGEIREDYAEKESEARDE